MERSPRHVDLVPIFLSGSGGLLGRLAEAIERTFALPSEIHGSIRRPPTTRRAASTTPPACSRRS